MGRFPVAVDLLAQVVENVVPPIGVDGDHRRIDPLCGILQDDQREAAFRDSGLDQQLVLQDCEVLAIARAQGDGLRRWRPVIGELVVLAILDIPDLRVHQGIDRRQALCEGCLAGHRVGQQARALAAGGVGAVAAVDVQTC